MKINEYIKKIKELGACGDALQDALKYETSQELWDKCERGDWMLWLIGKTSGDSGSDKRKKLVLTACKCARLALPFVKEGELRPLKAIETAEQWARGENDVTLGQVRNAAYAAYAAYAANAAAYAAYAAYAADAANAAAYAAAYAAYAAYAADAANAAAYAAYAAYAADAAARKEILIKCAEIVRGDFPEVDQLFETLPELSAAK